MSKNRRTINDLKSALGERQGVKTNKYLLELPVPSTDINPPNAQKIDILCQSATFPEINMATTTIFHKGRRYQVRGEIDYGSDYVLTFLDDDRMLIRRMFESWIGDVDNSTPYKYHTLLKSSHKGFDLFGTIDGGIQMWNNVTGMFDNMSNLTTNIIGLFDTSMAQTGAKYMSDFNVWQLAGNSNGGHGDVETAKVYGHRIQGAFPKSISSITYADNIQNELVNFSVTFGFSEVEELFSTGHNIANGVINMLNQ